MGVCTFRTLGVSTIGSISRKTADSVVLDIVAGHHGMIIPGRPITISRMGPCSTDFSIENRSLVEKNSIERLIECQEDNAAKAEKGTAVGKNNLSFPVSRDTMRKIRKGLDKQRIFYYISSERNLSGRSYDNG